MYLPELIPQMLNVLHTDRTKERGATQNILHALEVLGTSLDDYLHLIVPAVIKLIEQADIIDARVRILAIQTLGRLCNKLNFSDYASRIIHPLARVLDGDYVELKGVAMETLCTLVYQLGSDYAIFIPMVNKVLVKHRIQHLTYETLVSRLLKNQPLLIDGVEAVEARRRHTEAVASGELPMSSVSKPKMNESALRKAWEGNQARVVCRVPCRVVCAVHATRD